MRDGWVPLAECGCCGSPEADRAGRVRDLWVLRCRRCGTLRASEARLPGTVYVEGYHTGEVDQVYDSTTAMNREYERAMAQRRLDLLERYAPPGRLLDVGGGVGNFAAAAAARGWRAALLEPVPDAVEDARRHGVDAAVGGIEDLRPGAACDVISMLHVLEHLTEPRESLRRAAEALRPGGHLLVEVPNHGSMARRTGGERWMGWWPGQHVYYFTKRTLTEVLRRAGFEVLDVRSITLAWDGLILLHHAYIVGLEPALTAVASLRRRFRRAGAPPGADAPGRTGDMPPPLRDESPARRLLLPVLTGLARIEERLGAGENIIAIARASKR